MELTVTYRLLKRSRPSSSEKICLCCIRKPYCLILSLIFSGCRYWGKKIFLVVHIMNLYEIITLFSMEVKAVLKEEKTPFASARVYNCYSFFNIHLIEKLCTKRTIEERHEILDILFWNYFPRKEEISAENEYLTDMNQMNIWLIFMQKFVRQIAGQVWHTGFFANT